MMPTLKQNIKCKLISSAFGWYIFRCPFLKILYLYRLAGSSIKIFIQDFENCVLLQCLIRISTWGLKVGILQTMLGL